MPLLRHFVDKQPYSRFYPGIYFATDPRRDGVCTPYTFTSTRQSPRAQKLPTHFYSHVVNSDPPVVSHKPLLGRRHHQSKTKPAGLTLLHTTYSPGRQLRRTSRLALAPVRASTHKSSTKTLPAGLTLLHSTSTQQFLTADTTDTDSTGWPVKDTTITYPWTHT